MKSIFLNFFQILDNKNKNYFLFLFVMSLFGAILEMASVGILIPIVILITESGSDLKLFTDLGIFENSSTSELLYATSLFLLIFFLIKSLYNFYLYKKIFYWIGDFSCDASTKIFKNYIYQDYPFFFKTNSSTVLQSLTRNITLLGERIMQPIMIILVEGSVILFLALFLLFINLNATIVILIFTFIFSLLFVKTVKTKLTIGGEQIQHFDALRIKKIQESLGSIKEIKLVGIENNIVDEYYRFSKVLRNSQSKHDFLLQTPKILIELFIVIFFIGFILFSLENNIVPSTIVTTLTAFAFAAFKMTPAINRILLSAQRLYNSKKSLEVLKNDLMLPPVYAQNQEINLNNESFLTLKLESLNYKYPSAQRNIFTNLNCNLNKNEILGITGKSGVGKTTLIDIFIGLLKPNSGKVLVNGKEDEDMSLRKKFISYVPQDVYIFDNTISYNICLSEIVDPHLFKIACKISMVDEYIDNLEEKYDTIVGEQGIILSGGQRQRLGIARALYRNPEILILDEATNALDIKTEEKFFLNLKDFKKELSIILVSHRQNTLDFSTRILNL